MWVGEEKKDLKETEPCSKLKSWPPAANRAMCCYVAIAACADSVGVGRYQFNVQDLEYEKTKTGGPCEDGQCMSIIDDPNHTQRYFDRIEAK